MESPKMADNSYLLRVRDLTVHFHTYRGVVEAVDRASFWVRHREIMGLVGESGCGKSVSSRAVLGLIRPPGRVVDGEALFQGRDLLKLKEEELREVRGAQISMIFQSAKTSLNPVFRVGHQIARVYEVHQGCSREEAANRAVEMLKLVNISEPEKRFYEYPHQLSGGMCQRVMIGMMLACSPDLLIADEPTTGLDVSIESQILDLMRDLREKTHAAILLITHDLGVIAETCDAVTVMHAGQVVESAPCEKLFANPLHPYTQGLLRSIPRVDREVSLSIIPGTVPSLIHPPRGCRFYFRCEHRMEHCLHLAPDPAEVEPGHRVSCHLYGGPGS